MRTDAVCFVRTYAVPQRHHLPGTPDRELPDWARAFFNSRYRAREVLTVTHKESQSAALGGIPARLDVWLTSHEQLMVVDVIVVVRPTDPDALDHAALMAVENTKLIQLEVDGDQTDFDLFTNFVVADHFGEHPGRWPLERNGWRRMMFGAVLLTSGRKAATELAGVTGITSDHRVIPAPHALHIAALDPLDAPTALGYLSMAALAGRTRLLLERAREDIALTAQEVLNAERDLLDDADVAAIPTSAVRLQARVAFERYHTAPSLVMGDDDWLEVFNRLDERLIVSDREIADFRESLSSLNSLADTVFSVAVQSAGRRASTVGFAFALLSVMFGTIAAVELARTEGQDEIVYWAAAVAATVLVVLATWWKGWRSDD